jgi:hypothetical protein
VRRLVAKEYGGNRYDDGHATEQSEFGITWHDFMPPRYATGIGVTGSQSSPWKYSRAVAQTPASSDRSIKNFNRKPMKKENSSYSLWIVPARCRSLSA